MPAAIQVVVSTDGEEPSDGGRTTYSNVRSIQMRAVDECHVAFGNRIVKARVV